MSDSRSAGYYSEQADKQRAERCPNGPQGKHDWKVLGTYPSTWYECKHCNQSIYNK